MRPVVSLLRRTQQNVTQGSKPSTSRGKPPQRRIARQFFGCAGRSSILSLTGRVCVATPRGLGVWSRRTTGGPDMAQAGGCVSLPHFVETSGVKRARGIAVLAAGILVSVFAGPSANAQYRGTPEQQQACTPDVMRLCNAEIPDVGRITACMKRNRSNLSPACGSVFGVGVRRHHTRHRA